MIHKKVMSVLMAGVIVFSMTGCGNNVLSSNAESSEQQITEESGAEDMSTEKDVNGTEARQSTESEVTGKTGNADGTDVLVAYFSRAGENYGVGVIEKGNTEIIAEMIAEETGGDLFHIETVNPYPEDYDECTDVAKKEQQDNARPELKATVEDMDSYSVIWIGFPSWWSDMPMAVYTFLESYDFSGKTIIPFCTHAGSGLANTPESIAEICTGAEVLDGYDITGTTAQNDRDTAKEEVLEWIADSGL